MISYVLTLQQGNYLGRLGMKKLRSPPRAFGFAIFVLLAQCTWAAGTQSWMDAIGRSVVDMTSNLTIVPRPARAVSLYTIDDCISVLIRPAAPAGYYPEVFVPTGVILG